MNPVMIRINKDISLEDVCQVFDEYTKYIVSEELGERKHFHVLLYHPEPDETKRLRNIRTKIKKELGLEGNKDYSTKNVEEHNNKVQAYVLKDGKYKYKGYTEDEINNLYKLSYKKYTGHVFKDELEALVNEYLTGGKIYNVKGHLEKNPDLRWFVTKYIELKVRYNQSINMNNIMSYVRLIDCKKNGVNEYVDEILAKLHPVVKNW